MSVECHKGLHFGKLQPCQHMSKMEMNGSGKHSSLLRCGNNYRRKSFMVLAPGKIAQYDYRTLFAKSNTGYI